MTLVHYFYLMEENAVFVFQGLYDIHIQLNGVPFLPWGPPHFSQNIYASAVMSHPVVTLNMVENVGRIVDVLKTESYNGFPVVDTLNDVEVFDFSY